MTAALALTAAPVLHALSAEDIKRLAVRYHAFYEHAGKGEFSRAQLWARMLDEIQAQLGVSVVDADMLAPYLA